MNAKISPTSYHRYVNDLQQNLSISEISRGKTGNSILSSTFNVNSEVKFGSETANGSQTKEQQGNANSVWRLFIQLGNQTLKLAWINKHA